MNLCCILSASSLSLQYGLLRNLTKLSISTRSNSRLVWSLNRTGLQWFSIWSFY